MVVASKESHFVQVETPRPGGIHESPKLTLEWTDLTKHIENKVTLYHVDGIARPTELLVIMGPSGSGKTSLLDCILGQNAVVQGSITVNGAKESKGLKHFASYVMQDDLFYRMITVREHLLYQADLRVGRTATPEQYTECVDTVLEELGLVKCRGTLISDGTLRGISGGERKRLSFATKLLTNPSLLFVDEPTSGLNNYMAETVVTQLQQIACDGRTVIATVYQPSSKIFGIFGTFCLLSEGSTVYHGKAARTVEYFAQLGFHCPALTNSSN